GSGAAYIGIRRSKAAARASRCSIKARSRTRGSVRCRMGTCVRAGGAVKVSRTEFSFRSLWTGLKDEVPRKSTDSWTRCQTKVSSRSRRQIGVRPVELKPRARRPDINRLDRTHRRNELDK